MGCGKEGQLSKIGKVRRDDLVSPYLLNISINTQSAIVLLKEPLNTVSCDSEPTNIHHP